jgi:hypothetical protein
MHYAGVSFRTNTRQDVEKTSEYVSFNEKVQYHNIDM